MGGLGLAITFGLGALTAQAQAPAAAPAAPPPAWKQGMPESMATSTLAPLAGKLTITKAADVPLDKIKVPAGFKVEVWADSIPGSRAITEGDDGKYYVGTRGLGRIYELTDDGKQRTSRIVIDKLNQPTATYKDGSLFVVAVDKVLRFDGIAKNPTVAPVDLTEKFNLPPLQHHAWKYVSFGPDGKLYVPFGAPCNICELPTPEYAQIRRYKPDGSGMEVLATGVRNTQGFDWHPVTKQLWFTNHGRDWMGDDKPSDELNVVSKQGENFGYPFCHQGDIPDPQYGKYASCDQFTPPALKLGAHVAPLGLHFYTGTQFPAEYKNSLFIARHGSWNRSTKQGYDVMRVTLDAKGKVTKYEPFLTGFLFDEKGDPPMWGRPVDLLVMPDGAMLVSDDYNGIIYRVSYKKP
jgi:glucose/arabinose dehydrogenase